MRPYQVMISLKSWVEKSSLRWIPKIFTSIWRVWCASARMRNPTSFGKSGVRLLMKKSNTSKPTNSLNPWQLKTKKFWNKEPSNKRNTPESSVILNSFGNTLWKLVCSTFLLIPMMKKFKKSKNPRTRIRLLQTSFLSLKLIWWSFDSYLIFLNAILGSLKNTCNYPDTEILWIKLKKLFLREKLLNLVKISESALIPILRECTCRPMILSPKT